MTTESNEEIARQCVTKTLSTIHDEDIFEYIISVVADWETFEDADGIADMLTPLLVRFFATVSVVVSFEIVSMHLSRILYAD